MDPVVTKVTGKGKSSNDPYPVGGYSEPVAHAPIVMPGELTMTMRLRGGDFKAEGVSGTFDMGLDGSIWLDITRGKESRRFVVRVKDVITAALESWDREEANRRESRPGAPHTQCGPFSPSGKCLICGSKRRTNAAD